MNGPRTIEGINATSRAVASTVEEPVSLVRYHANENSTTALPTKENAWLIHNIKNFLIRVALQKYKKERGFLGPFNKQTMAIQVLN
jgi:hypothetical protein